MAFYENYLYFCRAVKKSPNKVAAELGLSSSVVTYWSKGRQPRDATLNKIADYFNIPMKALLSDTPPVRVNIYGYEQGMHITPYPVGEICAMPIVGSVRAGYGESPRVEYENEYVNIPRDKLRGNNPADCRIIRVRGDSMYPRIMEGDLIVVHLQNEVDSGDVAVVFNGDDEATLKKVRICDDHIELIPANGKYETKIVAGKDLAECRIYGKVLSLIRDF